MATVRVLPPRRSSVLDKKPEHKPLSKTGIAKLKDQIWQLWKRNHRDRFLLGKKLAQLQTEHGKPGHGTFLSDLDELDIPHWTAYRLIANYQSIRSAWIEEGLDFGGPVRLLQSAKDRWEIEDVDAVERAMEEAEADGKATELQRMIDAELAKFVKIKAKKKNRTPDYRIFIQLSESRREKFKRAWNGLEEKVRSRVVCAAVMSAADKN